MFAKASEVWTDKAATLVSCGSRSGARASEHLRRLLGALQMAHVQQLSLSAFTNFDNYRPPDSALPDRGRKTFANVMSTQLETWAGTLGSVREGAPDPGIEQRIPVPATQLASGSG